MQTFWLRRLLYILLIIKVFYWLLHFDLLYGEQSIIYLNFNSISLLKNPAFLLLQFPSARLNLVFILAVLFFALFGFLSSKLKFPLVFISNFLLWFFVLNLHNRLYPTLSGGNFLLNQLLFFNCFLIPAKSADYSVQHPVQTAFHNTAAIGLLIQISLVYFLSGLAKFCDPTWLSGEAVKYTLEVEHFRLYPSSSNGKAWDFVWQILNYGILIYQLSFPIAVWIKKIKKPFLLFGILMHLYIAFFMGLPEFGFIMIITYCCFWPFKSRVT